MPAVPPPPHRRTPAVPLPGGVVFLTYSTKAPHFRRRDTFKGAESPTNKLTNEFEKIVEVMYRYQINDYLYASAYYHMVMDAAYRDRNFAAATGLQLGICF